MSQSARSLLRARWLPGAAVFGAVALLVALSIRSYLTASPQELLKQSRAALRARDFEKAERLATRVPEHSAEFPQACLVAGEAATRLKRLKQALRHYRRVPDEAGTDAIKARSSAGDILLHLGRPTEAEKDYAWVLARQPNDLETRARRAALLSAYGRRFEAIADLMVLVRSNRFTIDHLLWLGAAYSPVELPEPARAVAIEKVNDPGVLVALARQALDDNDHDQAARLSRAAIAKDKELISAWACLGLALAPEASEDFLEWHFRLPKSAEIHPDVWLARGVRASAQDEQKVAARCFWEAVRQDPNHRVANYQLGQLLRAMGNSSWAAVFLTRADRLEALEKNLDYIFHGRHNLAGGLSSLRRAAEQTESLGRLWEAAAWANTALAVHRGQVWALELLRRVGPRLRPDLPRTAPDADPTHQVNLSTFPLPAWRSGATPAKPTVEPGADPAPPRLAVRFANEAAQAGIDFRYFNGYTPASEGKRMFATTGGGVAVLDYDGDDRPDLYFTQGCRWPPREDREHVDRLYQNPGMGRFQDVTEACCLGDDGYSQGVTVGDIDNDGFPDLYVANVGRNRLYRNNGDGTFSDATVERGFQGDRWTSSCLMADLNGDGFPDIYDVNYLAGPKAYTLICYSSGRPQVCDPGLFEAAQDQLFVNLRDGRFRDVTDAAGIVVSNGKGLGILAADFADRGRLDLFIANDGVPNFYFVNETEPNGLSPLFREQALLSGLAFNGEGDSEACMGVAADDADGDGRLDLFVTNYHRESNTLYQQSKDRLFVDMTRRTGLRNPSFWLLGFGTQFLDADLDGAPDLVLTNGHVGDFTSEGLPYAMRPQYFHNVGGGRFVEVPAESFGPFFQGEYVGRGLARLDWNGDGREDFVVSHLDAPAALLTNRTEPTGHFLALRLCGTASSRDAIATTVRVTVGERTRVRQLTAGDGYYASNERQLVFGLGEATQADKLVVRWPSGSEQILHNIPANHKYLVIEGRRELIELAGPRCDHQ